MGSIHLFPFSSWMRERRLDAGREMSGDHGKTDFEVVVYPDDTHAFTLPSEKPHDYRGRHMVYDEKATQDTEQRAHAFMAAHMK
jgi:dienelactone hydrolase